MANKLEYKEIKLGEEVNFKWKSPRYGWAYFDVCQVWYRGKIKKLYIISRQMEENINFIYDVDDDFKAQALNISSYTFNNSDACVTENRYCKEHKAVMSKVRVPKESEYFTLCLHFGDTICLDFHKRDALVSSDVFYTEGEKDE